MLRGPRCKFLECLDAQDSDARLQVHVLGSAGFLALSVQGCIFMLWGRLASWHCRCKVASSCFGISLLLGIVSARLQVHAWDQLASWHCRCKVASSCFGIGLLLGIVGARLQVHVLGSACFLALWMLGCKVAGSCFRKMLQTWHFWFWLKDWSFPFSLQLQCSNCTIKV